MDEDTKIEEFEKQVEIFRIQNNRIPTLQEEMNMWERIMHPELFDKEQYEKEIRKTH